MQCGNFALSTRCLTTSIYLAGGGDLGGGDLGGGGGGGNPGLGGNTPASFNISCGGIPCPSYTYGTTGVAASCSGLHITGATCIAPANVTKL